MIADPTYLLSDQVLAGYLAREAGLLLAACRRGGRYNGAELGRMGDASAHDFISSKLAQLRPHDGLLSEEGCDDVSRLENSRVWIVDPLDGTREFSEWRADWAVHVALAVDGVPVVGAVAQPDLNVTYESTAASRILPQGGMKILVSRSRPPAEAVRVAAAVGATLVGMGSAGAKAMGVLRGEAHAYIHSGGQYEWDSCAPVAVAIAAGLHASRIDGTPLVYNQPSPYLPDLIVCHPEVKSSLLEALARSS